MENKNENVVVINEGITGPDAPSKEALPSSKEAPNAPLYAGKFKSAEELEQAYIELQKKLGERKPNESPENEPPKDASEEQKGEEPKFIVAGKDFTKYARIYYEKGELDEESYKELGKEGFPREVVDAYINGLKAPKVAAKEVVDSIKASVGGEEAFQQLVEWAKVNLSPEEIKAYNKAIDTSDPDIMRMAVERLRTKYETAYGKPPKLVAGKATNSSQEGFRSLAEIVSAMKDPRYKSDPAYRADVEARIARSSVL